MKISLIIPAGGSGKRFGSEMPKQFTDLMGIPVIVRSIKAFETIEGINAVIIPVISDWLDYTSYLLKKHSVTIPYKIVKGGAERRDSVNNALNTVEAKDSDIILIHDAVRPLVSQQIIRETIKAAEQNGAAVPGIKLKDTVRIFNDESNNSSIISRDNLRLIQTPQGFRTKVILEAYKNAISSGYSATDDSGIVEYAGNDIKIIDGDENNFKITTPTDFSLAELILSEKI